MFVDSILVLDLSRFLQTFHWKLVGLTWAMKEFIRAGLLLRRRVGNA